MTIPNIVNRTTSKPEADWTAEERETNHAIIREAACLWDVEKVTDLAWHMGFAAAPVDLIMSAQLPDFGEPHTLFNPADPESPLLNAAAVLALSASEDTPQSVAFRTAIVDAWPRWKDSPLPDEQRRFGALAEAFAAIGAEIKMPGQMPPSDTKH